MAASGSKIRRVLAAACLSYFALWPLYQAMQHAPEFSISFNGMAIGSLSLFVAIFALAAGPLGLDRKLYCGKPVTEQRRKRVKFVGIIFGLAVAGLTYGEQLVIEHLGYTVHSPFETKNSAHR